MAKKKSKGNKIDDILEMPKEIYTNDPKLTIVGFEEVVIENYKGILEYEDFYIRINTYIGTLNINGSHLKLDKMTNDDIKITGRIESLNIERTIE